MEKINFHNLNLLLTDIERYFPKGNKFSKNYIVNKCFDININKKERDFLFDKAVNFNLIVPANLNEVTFSDYTFYVLTDGWEGNLDILSKVNKIKPVDIKVLKPNNYEAIDLESCVFSSVAKQKPTKYSQNKTKWSLIPMQFMSSVAKVFSLGVKKYSYKNYFGLERHEFYDAIMRHVDEWWTDGKKADDESGEHPLVHVICNCLMVLENEEWEEEKKKLLSELTQD